jgi:hypothetical protein
LVRPLAAKNPNFCCEKGGMSGDLKYVGPQKRLSKLFHA